MGPTPRNACYVAGVSPSPRQTRQAINNIPVNEENELLPPHTSTQLCVSAQNSYNPAWTSPSQQTPGKGNKTKSRPQNESPQPRSQDKACWKIKGRSLRQPPRSEGCHLQHTAISTLLLCRHRMKPQDREGCQQALSAQDFPFLAPFGPGLPSSILALPTLPVPAREGIGAACSILRKGHGGGDSPLPSTELPDETGLARVSTQPVQGGGGITSRSSYKIWRV